MVGEEDGVACGFDQDGGGVGWVFTGVEGGGVEVRRAAEQRGEYQTDVHRSRVEKVGVVLGEDGRVYF